MTEVSRLVRRVSLCFGQFLSCSDKCFQAVDPINNVSVRVRVIGNSAEVLYDVTAVEQPAHTTR